GILQIFDFFFEAEDGIRDRNVAGVQTCSLRSTSPAIFAWCCTQVRSSSTAVVRHSLCTTSLWLPTTPVMLSTRLPRRALFSCTACPPKSLTSVTVTVVSQPAQTASNHHDF